MRGVSSGGGASAFAFAFAAAFSAAAASACAACNAAASSVRPPTSAISRSSLSSAAVSAFPCPTFSSSWAPRAAAFAPSSGVFFRASLPRSAA